MVRRSRNRLNCISTGRLFSSRSRSHFSHVATFSSSILSANCLRVNCNPTCCCCCGTIGGTLSAAGAAGVVALAPTLAPAMFCKSLPGVTTVDGIVVSGVMLMNCMISSTALGSAKGGKHWKALANRAEEGAVWSYRDSCIASASLFCADRVEIQTTKQSPLPVALAWVLMGRPLLLLCVNKK